MLKINPKNPAGSLDLPFRVRYYDDVMERSRWDDLAATFPADEVLHSLNAVGKKNNLCDRDEGFEEYVAAHPGWLKFITWLRPAFSKMCADALGLPLSGKAVRIEFSALPGDGGRVMPHPDTAKKIATAVMYFAQDWDTAWGGAFEALRHKTDPNADFTDRRCHWEDVETILSIPMVPNRILFMQRTHNSLHGVRPVNAPRSRRTITVNLIGRPR